MTVPLACTVRDCGLLLERSGRTYGCARGHSYDVARSGYINLLQPNDRRSPRAGDTADAIAARARLLARGIGTALINCVAERVLKHAGPGDVVADLGSGSGELLAAVVASTMHDGVIAVGVDLPTAAAEYAARHHRGVTWVVASADRRLPLLDRMVEVVVSVHGRRHPDECARVVRPHGHLVVAVPAPDDHVELRRHVQGDAIQRVRDDVIEQAHTPAFELVERIEVREARDLDAFLLRDLLTGTYRGARRSAEGRIASLERLHVTLASTVFVFSRRG